MRLNPLTLVTALGLCLAGCATPNTAVSPLTRLLDGIEQRLDIAEAVALHKWDTHQSVQAPQREREVLTRVRQSAADYGLDAARAEAFFADQIEANKLLQYHFLNDWHRQRQAPDTPRRDLTTQIRPQLDQLQNLLLLELAQFDRKRSPQCSQQLADALAQRAPDAKRHLALVRATTQLCAGL